MSGRKGENKVCINHLCHLLLDGGGHWTLDSCALLSSYLHSTLHFDVSVCSYLISA